ncbi:hypothetical protein RF11_14035 [Thelohanellus kitauei]|uniref:DDE-1 domain-containing protein n=1 Tax=Thelohanellus kitauei TaxID=669202 RepID=A0A0C2ISU5_THEKT|nr:hypothetical protein RF11_14035 [Thelohanellus kitauei]
MKDKQEHSKENARERLKAHNITLKKAQYENGISKNESCEHWKTRKIGTFLENSCADDISNADETGLYYRATPDDSLCYKHMATAGYKNTMDRITTIYKICNRNFFSRYNIVSATNGYGVIKNFVILYRGKWVYDILESIDENLLTSSITDREISSKMSLLQAIQFVADSWRAIKTTTIQNCCTICGSKPLDIYEILSNEENRDMLLVPIINIKEFSTKDNNLPHYDNIEDCARFNCRS